MKAYIECFGDRSVGLFGISINIDTGVEEFEDKEDRESVRKTLSDCFTELWNDKAEVIFEDEERDELDINT